MRQSTEEKWQDIARDAARECRCVVAQEPAERFMLSRLKRSGYFMSPMRGMYAETESWKKMKRATQVIWMTRTLAAQHPDWSFCSFTAALLHGLWVANSDLLPFHVVTTPSHPTKSTKTIIRHPMDDPDCGMVDGVPVTTLEQTLVNCLSGIAFPTGIALADSALRISGLSREHFIKYAKERSIDSSAGYLSDLFAQADPRSESGGESIARAVMIEQGFQVPELQVSIDDPLERGAHYRVDYLWRLKDGSLVAGELDGREKYVNEGMTGGRDAVDVLADERLRESRLGAAGLKVVRFSYADVANARRFSQLLELYGIPRGPARPWGRRW